MADHSWITLRVFAGTHGDAVAAALFGAGALGVEEKTGMLVTHVASRDDADRLTRAALAVGPGVRVETEALPDTDWSEEWKRGLGAQQVGALLVTPPWLVAPASNDSTIVIDPGMAFGTGDHASTRGVLRLMQAVIRSGDHVADLGSGSAILAIAAAKLGASRVAAIEIDPDAIENAESNIRRNGVSDRVALIEGDAETLLPLVAPVRVVTANIISSVLLQLLPVIDAALGADGRVIMAGILSDERDAMLEAVSRAGWQLEAEDREDVWWSATLRRP